MSEYKSEQIIQDERDRRKKRRKRFRKSNIYLIKVLEREVNG